jgi:hypothetical protein
MSKVMPATRLCAAALAATLLGATLAPETATAGPLSLSQTVRWLSPGESLRDGDYWISYTSLSYRAERWSVRGAVSWLSWRDDAATDDTSESGFGALHLTGGRRIWTTSSRSRDTVVSEGWVQLRTKLPLEADAGPLGSGEIDWGASLKTTTRWRRLFVLGEVGYLDLGEPRNISYRELFSASLSMSYRLEGLSAYPLVSAYVSSSSRSGDPAYAEIAAGLGFPLSRRTSSSVLVSRGLGSVSPELSVAAVLSWRP